MSPTTYAVSPQIAQAESNPRGRAHAVRTAVVGGLGSYIEWFDYSIYALFAGFFATQFFGEGHKSLAVLATFAVFAVGFLARPTGAWVFGKVSDRHGRQIVLVLSVVLMSGGNLAIGLCPTAEVIGVWAAVILLVARLGQGVAMGAEHGSAPCYLVEQAPSRRRALFTSAYSTMSIAGSLSGAALGLLMTSLMTDSQIESGGWRIPFLIGAGLGVLALVIRRLARGEGDIEAVESPRPLRQLWRHHRGTVLRIIPIAGAMSLAYWALLGAFPEMAIAHGASSSSAFTANTLGLLVMVCFLPVFATLSDRYGRRIVLGGGLCAQAIVVVPALALMSSDPGSIVWIQLVVAVPAAAIEGALYATLVEKLPTHLRGVGVGLPLAIGVAIFGGTSPLVQTAMTNAGLPLWSFGCYVMVVLMAGSIAAWSLRETAFEPLPQ